jgi:hypothetical protein
MGGENEQVRPVVQADRPNERDSRAWPKSAALWRVRRVWSAVIYRPGASGENARIHPAIFAQATTAAQLMLEGRFSFRVGIGENPFG